VRLMALTAPQCECLRPQGRHAPDRVEAILLYEQNLADSVRVLGEDHPDTQSSFPVCPRAVGWIVIDSWC
jgi:hypothetical protein